MKILIAGATGAIGRPLVERLLDAGHVVAAIARDEDRAALLRRRGVEAHVVDVFDGQALAEATAAARPEVVVNQLTAMPKDLDIRMYKAALAATNRLRVEATPHLIRAARSAGARRVIVQSMSFITAPEGPPVHDEDARTYDDAPPAFRDAVAATTRMERETLAAEDLEPVVLRYGFLYGPGTYYSADGTNGTAIRARRLPLVAGGTGVCSFVHVDDAAGATVAALTAGAPGIYNVTDDDPAAASEWLPVAAQILGAKKPLRVPRLVAKIAGGAHAVHFATTLRGNSNARFKQTFSWIPARPSWRTGFVDALAPT